MAHVAKYDEDMGGFYCEECEAFSPNLVCSRVHPPTPRKMYVIRDEDTARAIAVFSRKAVEATFGKVTAENAEDAIAFLTGWGSAYGGPGRGFRAEPTLRINKRNIEVRQFSGLDI